MFPDSVIRSLSFSVRRLSSEPARSIKFNLPRWDRSVVVATVDRTWKQAESWMKLKWMREKYGDAQDWMWPTRSRVQFCHFSRAVLAGSLVESLKPPLRLNFGLLNEKNKQPQRYLRQLGHIDSPVSVLTDKEFNAIHRRQIKHFFIVNFHVWCKDSCFLCKKARNSANDDARFLRSAVHGEGFAWWVIRGWGNIYRFLSLHTQKP